MSIRVTMKNPGISRRAEASTTHRFVVHGHENDVRNLFPLCADTCGENDEIVSTEKMRCSRFGSMPLLLQEPI
jgi:hypothetical protein